MIRRLLCAFLAGLAILITGCAQDEAPVIFSLPAAGDASAAEAWHPLLTGLRKATGRRVQPMRGSSQGAAIDALRFGQVDLAWFDATAALEAVRRADVEVFARPVRPWAPDGERALLIVRKGSGPRLSGIVACDRSLVIGLGEPGSIEGDLAPAAYLFRPRGIDPHRCFRSLRTASAEANLYGVATGVLDAAIIDAGALTRFGQRPTAGGAPAKQVESVWASPVLPDAFLVRRKAMPAPLKASIADFLFDYDGPSLNALGIQRFGPAENAALDPLRLMLASQQLAEAEARRDPSAIARAQAELAAVAAAH